MNFTKSKVLLKKINAIHESAASFDQSFSSLEKDLILQYLRDLYEVIAEDEETKTVEHKTKIQEPIIVKEQAPKEPALMANEVQSSNGREKKVAAASEVQTIIPSNNDNQPVSDDALTALFDVESNNDLSHILGNSSVSDISRAMGINEKILTMNELFGGDQKTFQETITQLNGMTNYEDACQFLMKGVAKTNEWTLPGRNKKAEVFIKLIRRKFS